MQTQPIYLSIMLISKIFYGTLGSNITLFFIHNFTNQYLTTKQAVGGSNPPRHAKKVNTIKQLFTLR